MMNLASIEHDSDRNRHVAAGRAEVCARVAGEARVLIPGGTGYVGGRVAETLHEAGWQVRVASRRARSWPGPAGSGIEVLAVDWRKAADRARALAGCQAVVMLAAANEIKAAQDPVAAADATTTQCLAWLVGAREAWRLALSVSVDHPCLWSRGRFAYNRGDADATHPSLCRNPSCRRDIRGGGRPA